MAFDPTAYPYDTIVRIRDIIGDIALQGSGVLIAPDEVLTASHVVYIEGKGTAQDISVTPAFNGVAPFGVGVGSFVHYFTIHEVGGALSAHDSEFDFALIHLSQPFTQLGAMGLLANYAGGDANVTGYPASAGGQMVTSSQYVSRDPLYSLLDGTNLGPGSSGGPVWITQNGAPYVVGVVSSGSTTSGIGYNALITNDIFNQIQGWIADDHVATGSVTATNDNIRLSGRHDQYVIARTSDQQTYIRDLAAFRDQTQTLPNIRTITFSDGTGVIDPTGNVESVTRLYQAAFNRTPDLPGLTLNAGLVNSDTVPLAALSDSFAGSPEFISHYGQLDSSGFVQQLYANVLHRLPDAGGQQNWLNALANGSSRGNVLRGFADSTENRADILPIAGDRYDATAYRMYQAALDRAPDAGGLANWSAQLSGGAPVEQVALGFTNSLEFMQRYGALSADDFVTRMYGNVLHRAPDAAGRQDWVAALQSGAKTQAGVMVGFSESTENRINTAPATHDGWVFIG